MRVGGGLLLIRLLSLSSAGSSAIQPVRLFLKISGWCRCMMPGRGETGAHLEAW